MSKSFWLLSAGFAALATPAYAQDDQPDRPTSRHRAGRPSRRRRRKTTRTSSSPPRAAARSSRTCRSPSRRSAASSSQNSRRDRHPPAQPARPVAARLLDRHRGERLGPYPRHRHGRRQSRPRKLGRRVRRRRLPLAQRHRPQRARRDRADRGAARPAGHPVRPQRLGRPDPRHHPPARITSSAAIVEADLRQLRHDPRRRRGHRPARRDASPPGSTRSMRAATASTTSSIRPAAPRTGSTTATASSSAPSCCTSPTTPSRSG